MDICWERMAQICDCVDQNIYFIYFYYMLHATCQRKFFVCILSTCTCVRSIHPHPPHNSTLLYIIHTVLYLDRHREKDDQTNCELTAIADRLGITYMYQRVYAQLFCSYNRSSVFVCILFGIEIENGILSYTPITICAARIISFLSLKILNTTLSARLPTLFVNYSTRYRA